MHHAFVSLVILTLMLYQSQGNVILLNVTFYLKYKCNAFTKQFGHVTAASHVFPLVSHD